MEKTSGCEEGESILSPPSSSGLPNSVSFTPELPKHSLISRSGYGTHGRDISLQANYFKAHLNSSNGVLYQYNVSITSENNSIIEGKGLRRKVMCKIYETNSSQLSPDKVVYDGGNHLYSLVHLTHNHIALVVTLDESYSKPQGSCDTVNICNKEEKKSKHFFQEKTFNVEITYSSKLDINSFSIEADEGSNNTLKVLNFILCQQAANRGCLLVKQSFFSNDSRNFTDIGGGVIAFKGFYSSFRPLQTGLALNMDVSTTLILKPGPVIDFILANQNISDPRNVDWAKAKKMLKNMRIKTTHTNVDFKIFGLSDKPCIQQTFSLKSRAFGNGSCEGESTEITVYEYFAKHRDIKLYHSVYMPCIDAGKPNRPNYIPIELCELTSLQLYKKPLSSMQRSSLIENCRQKPEERMSSVTNALTAFRYQEDPVLLACGISIEKQMSRLVGRVLDVPKLKVGQNEDCVPQNGRWSFKGKKVRSPMNIENWAVVNFSFGCDTSHLSRLLIKCGRTKGINIDRPHTLIEEDLQVRRRTATVRVDKMFEIIISKFTLPPKFILCLLPEKRNSDLYGPWKKKCLSDFGIINQCISPSKPTEQYLTNVLLKINTKLGGINSVLEMEYPSGIPLIKDIPTMILGIHVSPAPPDRHEAPSIVSAVGSRSWPLISRYRAVIRAQSLKSRIVDCLYKPLADGTDDGMIRDLLLEFYRTSRGRKPSQIVVFRDGVVHSQFNQVLEVELTQIMKAYQHLGETDLPKFTVIVAHRNHHTNLFQDGSPSNVPPGTIVDTDIVHPNNYDFYLCSHTGIIGTSRPTHYTTLLDEVGFSPDELQMFVHSLSYVYQRSTSATSVVAPLRYARLAALQVGQFKRFEKEDHPDSPGNSSNLVVSDLPRLHKDIQSSMFFC